MTLKMWRFTRISMPSWKSCFRKFLSGTQQSNIFCDAIVNHNSFQYVRNALWFTRGAHISKICSTVNELIWMWKAEENKIITRLIQFQITCRWNKFGLTMTSTRCNISQAAKPRFGALPCFEVFSFYFDGFCFLRYRKWLNRKLELC